MPDRQALVLLPGLVCDAEVWRHQVAYLADIAEITVPPLSRGDTMSELAGDVLSP